MGLPLGYTRTIGISLIFALLLAPIPTTFADDSAEIFTAEAQEGIAWIAISCGNPNHECEEVNLTILWPDGSQDEMDSSINQEIIKNINSGTVSISAYASFLNSGWILDLVLPSLYGHEISDHPQHSGNQGVVDAIFYNQNTGTLSGTDSDVIHIPGNKGDILRIHPVTSRYPLTFDLLDSSGQAPNLIGTLNQSHLIIEIPTNDGLYAKIHSNDGEDENPYSFNLDTWSDINETTEQIYPGNTIIGSIGPMDVDGDYYDLLVGPGEPIEIEINANDWIELQYIVNGEMVVWNQSSGIIYIENVGEINTTFRIHIYSGNAISYTIVHTIDAQSDGQSLGDAPDILPSSNETNEAWPEIYDDGGWWNGNLNDSNDIDYWIFEVTDSNGSIAHLIPAADSADCCLMEVIPLYSEWNFSETGEVIQLEQGTHAIRISSNPNRTSESTSTSYSLRLELQEIDEPVYVDRSDEFIVFYVVIGFLMLSPLLPIAYWQWKDRGIIRVEKHEKFRLIRLRERLSGIGLDSQEDEDIDAALSSLGDAEWDALIHEWGKPDVRHSTEDLDIAAWRLETDLPTLLIGLRPKVTWEHAGIRLAATMGDRITIEEVHPSHLHFEDEIVLDKMKAQTLYFLRVQHSHGSTKLDVVVTGTVEGIPTAAMPTKALEHSEE